MRTRLWICCSCILLLLALNIKALESNARVTVFPALDAQSIARNGWNTQPAPAEAAHTVLLALLRRNSDMLEVRLLWNRTRKFVAAFLPGQY
jgi:hypothetical protein